MKGHKKEHKATGGKAGYSEAEGTAEERKEVGDDKSAFKKGGKAMKKKHGGKVAGKKPSKRADKFARGGKIHINPKHKGLLTKEVGKKGLTTGNLKKEIAADKKSGNVAKEKREVFALNAKKWKH